MQEGLAFRLSPPRFSRTAAPHILHVRSHGEPEFRNVDADGAACEGHGEGSLRKSHSPVIAARAARSLSADIEQRKQIDPGPGPWGLSDFPGWTHQLHGPGGARNHGAVDPPRSCTPCGPAWAGAGGSLLVATALLRSLEGGVRPVRWAIGLGPDPARAGPNGLSERASRRGLVKSSGGYGSSFTVAGRDVGNGGCGVQRLCAPAI